jgi:DNA mismatch repair protein MutS2
MKGMGFTINDHVFIISLSKTGIISKILKRGRYQVLVDQLRIECHEADLRALERDKKRKQNLNQRRVSSAQAAAAQSEKTVSIDMHGMRTDEAIQALEQTLSNALINGADRVEIIHGIGTGAVAGAVERYLENNRHVQRFSRDPKNPGVTWVIL